MNNVVFLSRRNLLTLLNKLDKAALQGHGDAVVGIWKGDTKHPRYPCTNRTLVCGIEDTQYYTDREPGPVTDAPGENA